MWWSSKWGTVNVASLATCGAGLLVVNSTCLQVNRHNLFSECLPLRSRQGRRRTRNLPALFVKENRVNPQTGETLATLKCKAQKYESKPTKREFKCNEDRRELFITVNNFRPGRGTKKTLFVFDRLQSKRRF